MNFATRQILDLFAPSNLPWANPEVLQATREQAGMNFANGAANLADDARRELLGRAVRRAPKHSARGARSPSRPARS